MLIISGLPLCGGDFSVPLGELPEPALLEAPAAAGAPALAGDAEGEPVPAGFPLLNVDALVRYLWNFDDAAPLYVDYLPIAAYAAAADTDASQAPAAVRNNKYFIESVRLTNLASESFEAGDYDASAQYAGEALEYAQRSDDYVALQLKIRDVDDSIAAARSRLEWAASADAETRFPQEYRRAREAFEEARTLRKAENWDGAIDAAHRVINALAFVTEEDLNPQPEQPRRDLNALPAQYTVRPWALSRDCLWNIAGRPWAYGDPAKWRILYNANRARMPQPDNPDLIHPGMILDIPSIKGEIRQGLWEQDRTYTPLDK
jgi:nucleoid-associated protein YgaU